MEKKYIVLVNGVKATEKGTLGMALKRARELKAKGYNNVSVAEKMEGMDYEPYNA
jgi:hypothetical protein